jgi:hypothetical protein
MRAPNSKTTLSPAALRQLPLPLLADEPPRSPPLPKLCSVATRQVWKTLSRAQQQQLRQTWLRVLREVVHE